MSAPPIRIHGAALAALLLAACAPPAPPVAAPAPAGAPAAPEVSAAAPPAAAPAAESVVSASPYPEPDEALLAAGRWWLLDADADSVAGISAERAYAELLDGREPARTVVVAILDTGVDVDHPDLDDVIWTNPDEVAGNGVDDDGNGYVDDVHGWSFLGGPGGDNVFYDTMELTRLYAALRPRFEDADPDTLTAAARDEWETWAAVRAEFEPRRMQAEASLQQAKQVVATVDRAVAMLRREAGTDTLTVAAVRKLRSPRTQVQQAQQLYLMMAAQEVTPELLHDELKSIEAAVEFGLNPEYDPHVTIVGDDPSDPSERLYGNADVVGPFAEHGSHVAGIVAAERGNGVGVDGIARGVRLMPVRVVPNGDERDKDVANAIRYAVDEGAHVINMSFGKSWSPGKAWVDDAVRYATERGVLLVHGAGNDAADVDTAANFPNRFYADGGASELWIEVGASASARDSLAAPFSNYGRERVDVFAPGDGIISTIPGGYDTYGGTSMAAPVVSGLAGLLMAYFPELDAADVRRIILETATPYRGQVVALPGVEGETADFGELSVTGGVVNVYAAVEMAERVAAAKR